MHGQVAERVVQFRVVHPKQRAHLGMVLVDESHKSLCLTLFIACVDAKLQQQHQFARVALSQHDAAQQARVLACVVKTKSMSESIIANGIAQHVVHLRHQVASFYGQNLVESTSGMETDAPGIAEGLAAHYLTFGEPALVAAAELQLIAVFQRLPATQDRLTRGQLNLADSGQSVHHLPLLPANLLVIAQALPFATAAHTKMLARGLHATFSIFIEAHRLSLGIAVLLLRQLQVNHIAGHYIGDENYQVVHACHCLAFGCHIRYLNPLQKGQGLAFSAHLC